MNNIKEDMLIKFLDLEKVNNRFRDEIDKRIKSILDKGWDLQGEWDKTFEEYFVKFAMKSRIL